METKIIIPTEDNICFCAEKIRKGEVVAVPTETVYGLCASALIESSIYKIFEIKKRPFKKPLSCNISSLDMLFYLTCEKSSTFLKLIKNFWPGPLTIVVPRKKQVLDILVSSKETIAIRFSSNNILKKLTDLVGSPLAIPSANISGQKSPTNAIEVYNMLNGRVEMIVDGGESKFKKESTIVSLKGGDRIKILREGVLKKSEFIEKGVYLV